MRQLSLGPVVFLAAAMLAAPAIAQDQKFALRFGLVMVEPTGDIFETHGGFEVDFEWYFHPRVGFEVASLGFLSSEFEGEGDYVTGMSFSTFTVGINGRVVRSKKVDFALGLLAGGATYRDIKVEGETATIEREARHHLRSAGLRRHDGEPQLGGEPRSEVRRHAGGIRARHEPGLQPRDPERDGSLPLG